METKREVSGFAPVPFLTESLPVRDRLPLWREVFGRVVQLDIQPVGEEQFRAEARLRALPDVAFASVMASPFRGTRTRELIQDERGDIALLVPVDGPVLVSQRGREATLAKGGAVFLRNGEVGFAHFPSTTRYLNLCIPEGVLVPMVSTVDTLSMTVVPAGNETLRLLLAYVELLQADYELASQEIQRIAATHIHDLVASMIGATCDAAAIADDRGIRAARLRAIKADIIANLCQGDLSVGMIAARQNISPRYVSKLFKAEGTTFSDFVLEQRLARSHRMLSNLRFARHTISAIAYDVGFGDLSYFNRTFRRRYGASPSDVRGVERLAAGRYSAG